ncbi:MAG: DUF2334 domain-containing protein [Meiothermus sp.]|nr:DUF2334 domain-containing protein [Meiothermus sp.]
MKLRQRVLQTFMTMAALLLLMACSAGPDPVPPKKVLILHGSAPSGAARTFPDSFIRPDGVSGQALSPGDTSRFYAALLQNLLGRYANLRIETRPAAEYTGVGDYVRVFYIGSVFNEALPPALLSDAAAKAPITWIGYNLWQIKDLEGSLSIKNNPTVLASSSAAQVDASFSAVRYRDYLFKKLTRSGGSVVPNEIVRTESLNLNAAVVEAWAENAAGEKIPYAVRNGHFWFIADLPFTYAHELDRYLVFADLLGPMLDRGEVCEAGARAVIRLEGVSPVIQAAQLKTAVDTLVSQQVPFAVSTIPVYKDGDRATVNWAERPEALEQLNRARQAEARIVQNGYSHQYQGGVTLADSEFWDLGTGQPRMAAPEAVQRLEAGKKILGDLGLEPVAWQTPSNAMPPDLYGRVNGAFPRFFERRLYQVGQGEGRIIQGQFFPYPVRDASGALMVPENSNYIGAGRTPADILEVARANKALRCPWLGLAFNPFLLGLPANQGGVSAQEFLKLVTDIRSLGYTFVDINGVEVEK